MRPIPFVIILCLFGLSTYAQLKLQMGEHYLTGINIQKLQVSPEDHTIWALTQDQKVYYKKETDADFQPYTLISGTPVSDIAGYSYEEMYFVSAPNTLIRVKAGVVKNFSIPDALATQITGIAIVSQVYNISTDIYDWRNGWLAIGTNDNFYQLQKGSDIIQEARQFASSISVTHDKWSYLRSSYKGATFINDITYNYSCLNGSSNHRSVNIFDYTQYVGPYPDKFPYPPQINTALMSLHPMSMFSGAGYNYSREILFWGTDQGLYAQDFDYCHYPTITKPFPDKVNGTSEAITLSQIAPQQYILAATDNGIQFTAATVFGSDTGPWDVSSIKFEPFTDFPAVKATDVLVDSRKDDEVSPFVFVCDKVAWVSTINGIYKVYLSLDQDKLKSLQAPGYAYDYSSSTPPVYNSNGDAVFNRCSNTQPISATLLNHPNSQLQLSWYKDAVNIPEWGGKQQVSLTEPGKYHAEITSLCEGITLKTINFILQPADDPQITFNYPDNINICEGDTYPLTTVNVTGYVYKWFKDNVQIPGALGNSYTVTQPGQYHVEVSNCGTFYKASKIATLIVPVLPKPIITADKTNYCINDIATLALTNAGNNSVSWYFNGTALNSNADQNSIAVTKAGNYTVKYITGNCEKQSDVFKLTFNEPINFEITKGKQGAICYGQSVTLSSSVSATSYLWSTGETTPEITVSEGGHYTLQLTSVGSCTSSRSTDIVMLPQVQITPIADTTICTIASEKLRINTQSGFANYNWNGITTLNPYYDVSQPGTYTLQVTTADGCSAQTIFKVMSWCAEIIVPNTFTPNGDGINDIWRVGGLDNDPTASILIFDRYGNRLAERKGKNFNWDGTYNGSNLPTGTYYYIIKTKNSKDPISGSITIIR